MSCGTSAGCPLRTRRHQIQRWGSLSTGSGGLSTPCWVGHKAPSARTAGTRGESCAAMLSWLSPDSNRAIVEATQATVWQQFGYCMHTSLSAWMLHYRNSTKVNRLATDACVRPCGVDVTLPEPVQRTHLAASGTPGTSRTPMHWTDNQLSGTKEPTECCPSSTVIRRQACLKTDWTHARKRTRTDAHTHTHRCPHKCHNRKDINSTKGRMVNTGRLPAMDSTGT